MNKFKNISHLVRLGIIYLLLLSVFLFCRRFLVPESYGKFGQYRGNSVSENAEMPAVYMGDESCKGCHAEQAGKKAASRHANVRCEVCHGSAAKHIEEPVKYKMIKGRESEACVICHGKSAAKPQSFPQIDTGEHNPEYKCVDCHDKHKPEMQ